MKFKARIEVRLKKDELDPEGETVRKSLVDLNLPVSHVRVSKVYEITFEEKSRKDAEAMVKLFCTRLLVNPTKDEYRSEVVEVGGSTKS